MLAATPVKSYEICLKTDTSALQFRLFYSLVLDYKENESVGFRERITSIVKRM